MVRESKVHNFIDSHCHLADERIFSHVEAVIDLAFGAGCQFLLQAGVDPNDWQRQEALQRKYPGKIGMCFGLHPYFVAAKGDGECEQALDLLAKSIGRAQALGEAGLDFRPHILGDSRERQLSFFEQQLELAQVVQKPVVLHLVQAHEEALQIIDHFGLPKKKGLVHSFNGSLPQAKEYLARGLVLSVGGPLLRPDNLRLKQAVRDIPLDRLLLESDTPDQPPPGLRQGMNDPRSVVWIAEEVAWLKRCSVGEVLDNCRQNFDNLFL